MSQYNTHSLIFRTRVIGVITALFLIATTVLAIFLTYNMDKRYEMTRAIMLYDTLFENELDDAQFKAYLDMHNLTQIDAGKAMTVMGEGEYLLDDPLIRKTFQSGNIEIFTFSGKFYYAYKHDHMYYYRSDAEPTPFKLYIIIIALVLALLLVFLHRYIESSIRPLRKLKEGIEKFAIGDKTLDIDTSGKDEVALVAKSFVKAVNEIEALERGRTLFLRNIMHELKTPLTRGKLISFMMKDEISEKEKLENIFNQMEMHLKDLVNIESLNSQKLQLDKKSYAAIDLVENALDKLDIQSEQISVNINVNTVEVDFELFSLAIKNLIDNARKYATTYPIEVLWDSEKFEVSNTGQALEKPIEAYFEAYTRDQSHTALEGMGLGLYITKEILEKHGCTLHYYYENGKHHFGIKQKCVMKQLI